MKKFLMLVTIAKLGYGGYKMWKEHVSPKKKTPAEEIIDAVKDLFSK